MKEMIFFRRIPRELKLQMTRSRATNVKRKPIKATIDSDIDTVYFELQHEDKATIKVGNQIVLVHNFQGQLSMRVFQA